MINRTKNTIAHYLRYTAYLRDFAAFSMAQKRLGDHRFNLSLADRMPILLDKTAETGFDAHYIYHNAWAIRKVVAIKPEFHVDISSTLYFCTSLSAFIPVKFFDYRPAPLTLSQLTSSRGDLMALPFADASVRSISCMHTIEHVGLGRYGDKIDPAGDLKAMAELKRVVAPGGSLLVVLPVGRQKMRFNAHRIYAYETVVSEFAGFELVETALVTDRNDFLERPAPEQFDAQDYGCGCFWFRKPATDGA